MSAKDLLVRVRATGRLWNALLVVLDAAVVVIATALAYYARFEGVIPDTFLRWMLPFAAVSVVLYGAVYATFGLYRLVLRFVGVDTLLRLCAAIVVCSALLLAADMFLPRELGMRAVPLGVLFIQSVLIFLGTAAARMTARVLVHLRAQTSGQARRLLILGAGNAGALLLREISSRPDLGLSVIGFLDDDPGLKSRTINGVPVLGTTGELAEVVDRLRIDEIAVAMPSSPRETVRVILNAAADAGVQTRIVPELVVSKGSVSLHDLRPVDIEDLLGREPAVIDIEQVKGTIEGLTIAVTGAAGSIGSELCRQAARLGPVKLVLIDIDETRLYELFLELDGGFDGKLVMSLCDIRDEAKLDAVIAMHKPATVLHAAAYKHVPLMELEPEEAIKTNVLGTLHVVRACERHAVDRFVLISTDKAVAPANTMGLTKFLAENITLDAARRNAITPIIVRFGNVLASRGSVVPIFEQQLRQGGPVTVTDPDVTRYFMTIPEASRLVLQAQAIGAAGDVFVLEMGEPVRILDLARKMIALSGVPADIEFTGLRPGEKLHESLVTEQESLIPSGYAKILRVDRVAIPDQRFIASLDEAIDAATRGDIPALKRVLALLGPGTTSGS